MVVVVPENFHAMVSGFHAMDEHFRAAPAASNLPMLLLILIFRRLQRMSARFAALSAASVPPKPHRSCTTRRPARPPEPQPPRNRLPRNFAWLIRLVPEAWASKDSPRLLPA